MKHARTQAFKTALRPTPAQARCMAQHIGYQRWSYNQHLAALQQSERKLRRCDKAIARSRNTHGPNQPSHRRQDLYAERARRHRRIRWQRETARRMAASAIAKSAGTVVVESLPVRGLVRNRRLAKALSDAGMGAFLTELAWQCTKRGVPLVEADRWFPSTQICACCGCRPDAKVDLSVRVYRCARCGWECDRDANAALNLAAWGAAHAAGEAVNGHGDGVSRPGARPDATVGEVPSDGTPVDLRRSTRIVPHRR